MMKCPAFLTPHLPYLRWGLPWVFIIPTLKIAGFLLWSWWLVCFTTLISPTVYSGMVMFYELKELKNLVSIKELKEANEALDFVIQEIRMMVLLGSFPDKDK